jgi:hypothetical protein
MEGTRIFMEAQEVCIGKISIKCMIFVIITTSWNQGME